MFALVLGGGGSAGIGWETGVLCGLSAAGVDVAAAARVIGTSAGAIVGARLRSGADPGELYDRAREPEARRGVDLDYRTLEQRWAEATVGATSAEDARRRIATMALDATTMPPAERRAEIAAMLPIADWPESPFTAVSVNGATGALAPYAAASGVGLLDAIAASCAVPGVWPPVLIGGVPHLDGAVRSPTNADLAEGCDRVLVIAPMLPQSGIDRELRRLTEGTKCEVISADPAAVRAFGDNPLDPRCGPAAAAEGLRQGRAEAMRIAVLLR